MTDTELSRPPTDVPRQLVSSGAAMATRQALGTLLSVTGTLVVTRIIGPERYGVFAAATTFQSYVASLANSGVEVSLIRTHGPEAERRDAQGLVLVTTLSVLGAIACLLLLPWLTSWISAPKLSATCVVVFTALPLSVIWVVPRARLSRRMDFRKVAVLELSSQAIGVGLALSLAVLGAGVWAPTLGWLAQQSSLTAGFLWVSRPWGRPEINAVTLRKLLSNSLTFSASSVLWQSKTLINPLIVGHYLGTESVGYVALCARIVEVLSFVRTATWHMLITSFSRIQNERSRLAGYIFKSAEVQVLALAPVLLAFALVGNAVFPIVMGEKWRPVLGLFPYVAAGALATGLVTPMAAGLYACGQDFVALWIRAIQVAVAGVATWSLVPRLGIFGFGIGELTVVVTSLTFLVFWGDQETRRRAPVAWIWFLAAASALFWRECGWLAPILFILAALLPNSREAFMEQFRRAKEHARHLVS